MNRTRVAALAVTALAVPALAITQLPTASAHAPSTGNTRVFHATLKELNGSDAHGQATLTLRGHRLTVQIDARGLAPSLVHAQHIHGIGNSECPPPSAAGSDGVLSTADGLPFYGPIVKSLTTHGDTSPAAALTIELMPKADANGQIHYKRTMTVPDKLANNLAAFQIVEHGVDFNHNHAYDFSKGRSELDPKLPQEATAPANCGTIQSAGDH